MSKKSNYHHDSGAAGVELPDTSALVPFPAADNASDDKPKPKPGDADYDWAQHYPDNTPLYVHRFPDGTVVALKSFGAIYSKTWLYKVRELTTDVDIEFSAIDRGACPEAKAVLLGLDDSAGDPIRDFYSAWIAGETAGDEGVTAGE
ncbi:hypothetical protein [Mycobacterium sp. 141]|uniref:hypothetical protein n=1 Tax=Mycobacterium sp. 141 TaxID=1120797 RepID=UPI00037AC84A|nr:hypothetical protein [Mycobacterium sp. 141]